MNINDTSSLNECTSCQLCGAVCPHDAISIKLNENGFYRPVVDKEKCVDCGACIKVCHKFDSDIKTSSSYNLNDKPLYAAWAKNRDVIGHTTSGGIGDILAKHYINEGYRAVGCVYDVNSSKALSVIADSIDEVQPFRGSKYIQSYTLDAFKEIVRTCRQQKYIVFGTPCQIYALNRYASLRKVRSNFIFVDLYCHGCPSMLIWKKYLDYVKRKYKINKIDGVTFRSKKWGWGRFCIEIISGGVVHTSKPYKDCFYDLFFCNQVLNDSCTDCKLRHSLEYTDLRLGDFWGKKYITNRIGVSGVSLATDKGKKVFDSILKMIEYVKSGYDIFLPYQSWDNKYVVNEHLRSSILNSLNNPEKSITDTNQILHRTYGVKEKMARKLKIGLTHLPYALTVLLKRL